MTRDEYLSQRNMLLNKAQSELDRGNIEASGACRTEITALDSKWSDETRERRELAGMMVAPNPPDLMDVDVSHGREMDILDITNSMDYRSAFKDNVLRGTAMPIRFRNADSNTLSTDVSSVIPTIVVNRIIEEMEAIGMILPLVTRTSYKSGVSIPTTTVKPILTWVNEGAGSDRQKTTTGSVQFTAHKARCEISMSMEVAAMSIDSFESTFVKQVARAMVKGIESKIISNDAGTASPKGILAETPPSGQDISVSALDYATLIEADSALPQAYENGAVWCMSRATYNSFLGMVDTVGQPIARTNHGLNASSEPLLLGRRVIMCGDYLPNYAAAADGDVFAFIFNFSDYVLNTIYDMGIQRKQDWETEDMLTKAVMSVDGKVVDKNSLVTLKKGAATP